MAETNVDYLGTEKIGKLMVKFSVPSIIALTTIAIYNIVDQIFIGQTVGYMANAATNVIMPLATLMIAFGSMLSDGTAAFMSLRLGGRDERIASNSVGNCVVLIGIIGILSIIVFEVFLEQFCWLFGATENTIHYALDYGRIIVIGFPLSMIDGGLASVIRADGRPRQSMYGMLMGAITNVILDAVFLMGLGMGVKGAAWATVIGEFLNAVYYVYLIFSFRSVHLKKRYLKLKIVLARKIFALGLPSFITQIATVITIFVMNNMIVKCGAESKYGPDIPLAIMGITMKFCTIAISISLGIANGSQPILGFNYGGGRYDRVKRAYKQALIASSVVMGCAFAVFELFPLQLISIFGSESELYMEFARRCIRCFLSGCVLTGAGITACILFQALGHPVISTVLTFFRQILILIPTIIFMGLFVGIDGLIWAGGISDASAGIISLITVAANWKKLFGKPAD